MPSLFKHIFPALHKRPVSIRRSVFRLSMPVLLSSLFQRFVGIADILMTGGLGATAIAATGLGQLLIFTTMTIFWGLSTGTTVVIAHLSGAGRLDEARRAACTAAIACLILTALCTAGGGIWGAEVARLIGATAEVQALARDYIQLVFFWMVWTTGVNILSAIMHGNGQTRIPMQGILLVNILHILIAWLLIYGKSGLPPLGVKGAAIAINISECFGFCYLLYQAFKHRYITCGLPDIRLFKKSGASAGRWPWNGWLNRAVNWFTPVLSSPTAQPHMQHTRSVWPLNRSPSCRAPGWVLQQPH